MHRKSFYFTRMIMGTIIGLLAVTRGFAFLEAIGWGEAALQQQQAWYRSTEARAVANSVVQYLSPQGGWPKSTDLAKPPRTLDDIPPPGGGRANSLDNEATTLPMAFLARMAHATGEAKYRDSVFRCDFSEISYERRSGYSYHGNWASSLLAKEYPAWHRRHKLP